MRKYTKFFVAHLFMVQVLATLALWLVLFALISSVTLDSKSSIAIFFAIPVIVISVTQLLLSAYIQKAAYIKDYALRTQNR